ncbi:putative hemin transport protein [Azospirillum sp. OGB3]|uniref:ChuX/HutX family heme-like substrate-binding protein n=1 Tax=Azospirillum sp. OGB3 TaxID=2587012 RepID=UPI0016057891|nr:ChuX/HutX family heme-like substrate-binding protein [Azospirillum sp. OGB3]MBB3265084.1 putative hemin transport protein [Azospirillum sp. OGB3]
MPDTRLPTALPIADPILSTLPGWETGAVCPTRLEVDWTDALRKLDVLGTVRVVTGNRSITHEKTGRFGNVDGNGPALIVLNREVDLRVFPRHWAITVHTPETDGEAEAIRVFDRHGRAVHAIHRTPETNGAAWDAFLILHRAADQDAPVLEPLPAPAAERPDAEIDVEGLRAAWSAMTDVHEFFGMLRTFGVGRRQALRLAGPGFARELPATALLPLLEAARDRRLEIMIFVGNAGCIQIHTGTVDHPAAEDGLLRIDDHGFTLRAIQARLSSAWVVHKPTDKGGITTVELYDDRGDNAAILCGQRDEDKPERAEWRALAASL